MTADFRDREGCLNRSNPLKRAGQRGAFISSDEEAVGSNPVTSTDWTSRAAACAVGLCAQISHTAVKYSNVEHPEADLALSETPRHDRNSPTTHQYLPGPKPPLRVSWR